MGIFDRIRKGFICLIFFLASLGGTCLASLLVGEVAALGSPPPPTREGPVAPTEWGGWIIAHLWMVLLILLILGLGGTIVLIYVLIYRRRVRRYDLETEPLAIVHPEVWLEVVKGPEAGLNFPLPDREIVIGRSSETAQFVLRDRAVSKTHARI